MSFSMRRKVVEKDQLPCSIKGVFTIGLCFPRHRATEEVYPTEEREIGAPSISPTAHGTPKKFGRRWGPSQGVIQKCEPQERNPCAPTFEGGTQQETLQQERCARRETWDLANSVHELKTKEKVTFESPTEAWVMPVPSSKKPEEREFVVDSGAPMHMLSNKAPQR